MSEFIKTVQDTELHDEMLECFLANSSFDMNLNKTYKIGCSPNDSGSFTPKSSFCSSISYSRHLCGSLFAKCYEHNRWPLFQTFTNRKSPLAQQTFSNKYYNKKNNECDIEYVSRKKDRPQTILKLCSEKNEKRHLNFLNNFSNSSAENLKKNFQNNSKVSVKRHNSLPESRRKGEESLKISKELNRLIFKSEESLLNDERQVFFHKNWKEKKNFLHYKISKSKSEDNLKINNCVLQNDYENNKLNKTLIKNKDNTWDRYRSNCGSEKSLKDKKEEEKKKGFFALLDKKRISSSPYINKDALNNINDHYDVDNLKSAVNRLKLEAKEWEQKVDVFETEIVLLRQELKKKDQENIKLQRDVHKLKSVLQETSLLQGEKRDFLSCLNDSHEMVGQSQEITNFSNPNKKQGISGESLVYEKNLDQIKIQRFDKNFRTKQLIKDAFMENDFLKNLDMSQIREIVETVYPKEYAEGDYVVREGETGSHLYISDEGELEVIKNQKVLGRLGPGKAFGELAILYNCRRTASIKVVKKAKVWVLDRQVFQKIMMKTGLQRLQENINFLRSVPLLKALSNEVLAKIADVLEVDFFPSGEHIIRQGAAGDTFFIISSGEVKVTQLKQGKKEEEEIRVLGKGDYFGEQALLKEDWRTANVIAMNPGVECLTLDRESFIQLIGDLSELQEKDYGDEFKEITKVPSLASLSDMQEYDYIRLEDLNVVATLGIGGFGRVELVEFSKNKIMTFALKCLKKQHIVETKQEEHVYSEKNIMMACHSSFICRLYKTFRDSKYVYMLEEALLGGEVWTLLRDKGCFDDYTTKFVTGCVVEAFEYLHSRGIIYRDLKPENLLLDSSGYVKLVDFGFSKKIGFSSKTWTFCGTPEYLAPEIILNKGHDRAVDYWSLGILMHELLTGMPPFTASDPMKTYNIILKGIDMVEFPKHITRLAQSLIKRLCRDSPSERLGYQRGGIQDIKKHKWFQGFDWGGLKQKLLTPPIRPLVNSPKDISNFDFYSEKSSVPSDEFSNWDAEF